MGANPHANGGLLLRDLPLPDFRDYAVPVEKPGTTVGEATRVLGGFLRDVMARSADTAQLPGAVARREQLQPPGRRAGSDGPRLGRRDASGRRRGSVPRRARDGDPERTHLPGLAGRVSAHGAARLLFVLRGVHPDRRLDVQPARQVAGGVSAHPLAAAHRVPQLSADVARLAAGPQRLLAPGPRLHRPCDEQEGQRRPRLPAARRQLPAVRRRPLPALAATTSTSSSPASSPRCST